MSDCVVGAMPIIFESSPIAGNAQSKGIAVAEVGVPIRGCDGNVQHSAVTVNREGSTSYKGNRSEAGGGDLSRSSVFSFVCYRHPHCLLITSCFDVSLTLSRPPRNY